MPVASIFADLQTNLNENWKQYLIVVVTLAVIYLVGRAVAALVVRGVKAVFAHKAKLAAPQRRNRLTTVGATLAGVAKYLVYFIVLAAMLGALGFVIVEQLNQVQGVPVKLGPKFVCLFALCFALTVGVLWEIYEFTFDSLLGMNMQKFRLEDGSELVGRAALRDTMKDLIVDFLGALAVVSVGYIGARKKARAEREAARSVADGSYADGSCADGSCADGEPEAQPSK